MNKFFKIISFSITLILAKDSPFRSFDVIVYPEYYYDGVMVEIESSINLGRQPFDLKMVLPSNIDSVFYVKKNESNRGNVKFLDIENKNIDPFVRLKIEDSEFQMFLFYKLMNWNGQQHFSLSIRVFKLSIISFFIKFFKRRLLI